MTFQDFILLIKKVSVGVVITLVPAVIILLLIGVLQLLLS